MPKNLRLENLRWGTELVKRGFAKMQKGGVVMDVTNAEQATIAEEAGAVAVMALERVPADIRAQGGVARMSDPAKILEIIDAVTIPVMAKSRIGHTAESKILQELGVDMIDESEVLTPADPYFHVLKRDFTVPFVCGATQLGEAVRRIAEGAAMIRTKGEAGTGNIVEAVRHRRMVTRGIDRVVTLDKAEIRRVAEHYSLRYRPLLEQVYAEQGAALNGSDVLWGKFTISEMTDEVEKVLQEVRKQKRLPVVDFVAGGIATPADAALVMQMGSDGVFVGSGIFKASNPEQRAKAIVEATTHFDDPKILAEVSKNLGEAMRGIPTDDLPQEARLAIRGI